MKKKGFILRRIITVRGIAFFYTTIVLIHIIENPTPH